MDLWEIEERGYNDATIRFSYIHPDWSKEEMNAWGKGYKRGLEELEKKGKEA